MEQLKMQSSDIAQENLQKLKALFPECITEAKNSEGKTEYAVDADVLSQLLNTHVVSDKEERFQFIWPGKSKAMAKANAICNMTLRPCPEETESSDFANTQNLYIEGDNLKVLKILRENYLGAIKMIYVDPPYNTGGDFIYHDDFSKDERKYKEESGEYDDLGNHYYENNGTNGRFHTDWLNMIYPRIKVAKDLLTQDGVLFISIDENELDNLLKVCNEIMGEQNFIAPLIWAAGRKNDSKYISVSHEYILCYVRDIEYLKQNKVTWREKKQGLDDIYSEYDKLKAQYKDDTESIERGLKAWYKNLPDGHPAKDHKHYCSVDKKGIYFPADISWPGGGGPKYQVLHPITGKPVKVPSRGWITNEKTLKEWIKEDKVDFGPNENHVPTLKSYLKDREYSVPYSVFYKDGRAASKRLATLMGNKVFENPKDEEVISRLIDFTTKDDDIILDFFSGSGTTAHAMFLSNKKDGGNRKFILVQIPEEINPEKSPAGKARKVAQNACELLDSLGKPHNLCEIGKERIRRAAIDVAPDKRGGQYGFRVLKLSESNMKNVFYSPSEYQKQLDLFDSADNIKKDRTDEDLLFQVLPEMNIPLSAKIEKEKIGGKDVFFVDGHYMIACFAEGLTDEIIMEIAKMKPMYFVMADRCAATDSVISNFDTIFKQYSKDTQTKII